MEILEFIMRGFVNLCVFVFGTFVTCVVMSLAGYTPDSFYDVFVPWLGIAALLMMMPKKVSGYLLALGSFVLVGCMVVGAYFLSLEVIDYFNQEPESVCSYDCDQPIPDTSDDIDLNTPTGDNNNSPGYHNVDGHYRGGTYVEPYIRSNPDGDPSNNIND